MFTAVYGLLPHDVRVLRATRTLATAYDVTVLSVASESSVDIAGVKQLAWRACPQAGAILSLVSFWWCVFYYILKIRPDIIYAHDYYFPAVALLGARLVGARAVYDCHELILPDATFAATRRLRVFYEIERRVIRHFDAVICTNAWRAELMRRAYGLDDLHIVQNVPDVVAPRSAPATGRVELSARNRGETLIYQGYVSMKRRLGICVRALQFLPEHIDFVILGAGPDTARLQTLASELGLGTRFRYLGSVPADDVGSVISGCSVGVVTYPYEGLNNIYCASNKIYEYVAYGLPVVTTAQPPLRQLIDDFGIGRYVEPGEFPEEEARRWAEAAAAVLAGAEQYKRNFPAFLRSNSWEVEGARLLEIVSALDPSG